MKFYYFNSTHWDREWYQPYQEFRKYLVDAARELLRIFDTEPEFRRFTFDGQTIVLEDITEIRPDWRPKLEELIRSGRLNVGPWYVMPDEFLVSGEAMIRNLQAGRRIAAEYGARAWPVGYACDIFGHIAQLPQIFAGFGFEGAVVWRGTRGEDGGHFVLWESPDGTRLKTLNLSRWSGYSDFTLNVRGMLPVPLDEAAFKEKFRKFVEEDTENWGDVFVLSDAFDHATPFGETEKMFRCIRELYPEAEIIHTDYTELFDREFGAEMLPVIVGEQIYPADGIRNGGGQISSTLSSRCDLKRANDLCQNELELSVEPEMAIRTAAGDVESLPLLRYTWKHFLQNHAHDSICGCSVDQVHRTMLCRYDEVRNLDRMLDEEFRLIDRARITGKHIYASIRQNFKDDKEREAVAADGCYTLRLFNPLPRPVRRTMELELPFPAHASYPYPKRRGELFGYEFLNCFRLYDAAGNEIQYQLKSVRSNQLRAFYRQDSRRYDIYTVICAPELPPCGWCGIEVRPTDAFMRSFDTLTVTPLSASNGLIRLDVNPDGTFDLTDLRSKRSYRRMNDFRIDREIGDGWNHVRPVGNRRVCGAGNAQVVLTQDGPIRAEFEITRRYDVPRALRCEGTNREAYAGLAESDEIVTLEIVTTISIDRGSEVANCRTVVRNNLCDYRLQLLVPTGISGDYFLSQSFAHLERPAGRTEGKWSESFGEPEMIEKNFDGVLGKRDEKGGIAFLSRGGIHEGGALTDENGSLVITLLRAFGRTVQTNGETEGQVQGDRCFEYALDCFGPESCFTELFSRMQELRAPVSNYMLKTEEIAGRNEESFITVSGGLAFTSLKPAEDGAPGAVILRLVNFERGMRSAAVSTARPVSRAVLCRLDETEVSELGGGEFAVTAKPGEIITLKLEFGQ